jgi:hypothetical protein
MSYQFNEISDIILFSHEEIKRAIVKGDVYVSQSIAIVARYLFSEENR